MTKSKQNEKLYVTVNDTQLDLTEWTSEGLRSAFIVDPAYITDTWEVFTVTRSQKLPGTDRCATRLHTNLPRGSESGLPKDWEAYITGWHGTASLVLDQVVQDWANETSVTLYRNQATYASATLSDLLLGGCGFTPALCLREGMGYSAVVETANKAVMADLRKQLRQPAIEPISTALVKLDILEGQLQGTVRDQVRAIRNDLCPSRVLTCWLHLDGFIKKSII